MNLWLVNQYAIPPSQSGGTRHHALARALIQRGHDVTLIAADLNYNTHRPERLAPHERWRREVVEGVPYVWLRIPGYSGNAAGRLWSMVGFAWRVLAWSRAWGLARPDVVMGSSPHLFAARAALALARRYRVPFVLEVRDLWPDSLVDVAGVAPGHPLVRLMRVLEKQLYRSAAAIVTLLPGATEVMVERGARREAITWIPNGIDLSLAPEPGPTPAGPFQVVYAGAHGVANALDSIVDAAALLQAEGWGPERLRLRFIGEGSERERLRRRVEAEGLRNLTLDGPVPKEAVYAELQKAHAFILTLRDVELYRHGISLNKLYDYLAMARPTVFGARAANNPIAEAGAGLVVAPEDARAMADALARLAAMPAAEREAMGRRGRLFAEEHHAIDVLAQRLEAALEAARRA